MSNKRDAPEESKDIRNTLKMVEFQKGKKANKRIRRMAGMGCTVNSAHRIADAYVSGISDGTMHRIKMNWKFKNLG